MPNKPSWHEEAIVGPNTTVTGTGTVNFIYKAIENDVKIDYIKFIPMGTNIQSVARLFINNGDSNDTVANNSFIMDIDLPPTVASSTTNLEPQIVQCDEFPLPSGYRLFITIATQVASGYQVTVFPIQPEIGTPPVSISTSVVETPIARRI